MIIECIPMMLLAKGTDELSGALSGGSVFDAVSTFFQFVFLIAIFIGIVYMAYFSTKWIARARNSISGSNLRVIESAVVGQQSTVQIIKAGNEFYLIGVTKENVTMLAKVDEQSIELANNMPQMNETFEKYYNKYVKKFFDNKKSK